MRRVLLIACLLSGVSAAEQPPKTMLKVEVVRQGSDVPAGSFASKPKVIYRAESRYCRVEEAPDPDQGIHGLLVINEPDYWMINLMSKTARHGLDPGPKFNCHMPIFADVDVKLPEDERKQITELEFGLEFEFFKSRGATPQQGPVLQTKQTMVYRVQVGGSGLALFTYGTPERPLAVAREYGDKHDIYWYSGYGQEEFDPKLFAKPEKVTIEDSKP